MASAGLNPAAARRAALDIGELAALVDGVDALPGRGWCAGAVVLAGRGPHPAVRHATGRAVAWDAVGRPAAAPVPMRTDTRFDLASLTKLCTAILAVQSFESGTLAPDRPVADHLPEFSAAGTAGITVRHLLDHTSGLRPELPFHDGHGLELLWAEEPRGTGRRRYSDLNYLVLQHLLERTAGRPLDALVREGITGPLGMTATGFGPVDGAAATEEQHRPVAKADRGMLRGVVHDENAHALGGVAGHAGLFATGDDLVLLCRALLDGGSLGGVRILRPASVDALLGGLGFAVDQPSFMGELAGSGAAGHTGFTGTSLVVDRATGTYLVLLANTVHPVRPARPDSGPRAAAATRLARAVRAGG